MSLVVSEIFHSLQGEASRIGLPTVFVRLTGCPLRCNWCDSAHAFSGGRLMELADILAAIETYPARRVCVTGGEPLVQPDCPLLLKALADRKYDISLETSGAIDLSPVDPRVAIVMDLKAPDSGEEKQNRWQNLAHLRPERDEIKFVIASRRDYEWASNVIHLEQLQNHASLLMSPVQGRIEASELAEWILADGLPVRFQLQLHKQLWGNMRGR